MVDYDLSDSALVGIVSLALENQEGLRLVQAGTRSVGDVLSGRRGRPVRIEREGENLTVDLVVNVDFGRPIAELAAQTQRTVADTLLASTGLKVRAVHITVVGVEYREKDAA